MRPAAKPVVSNKSPLVPEGPKKSCLSEIQRLQKVRFPIPQQLLCHLHICSQERDERRKNMDAAKLERAAEDQRNKDAGNPGDVDFMRMIRKYRDTEAPLEQAHTTPGLSY